MPRIFDFNLEVYDRFVTLASIAALKGTDKKLVEVTADSAEDAAAEVAAGGPEAAAEKGKEDDAEEARKFLHQ